MTFAEALAELGIDPSAGPDQARRAYLRLLKTRKPETDPQGFMRLREAYDLVKPHLEMRRYIAERVAVATPAEEAKETAEPAQEADASAVIPARETTESSAGSAGPPGDDHPRSGADHPRHDEPPSLQDFFALFNAGRIVPAAEVLTRLFQSADLHEGVLPVPMAIHLVLKLHADDEVEPAAALTGATDAWLRRSGQEMRLIRGNAAATWAITRELSLLSPSFPPPMRAAIARAALAGDLGQARSELAAIGARRPQAGRAAAGQLRATAPVLAATLASALDPRLAVPAPSGSRSWFRGGWPIILALIGLSRIFGAMSSSTPSYDSPRRSETISEPPQVTTVLPRLRSLDDLKAAAILRAERVRERALFQMGAGDAGKAQQRGLKENAKDAEDAQDALDHEDCVRARAIVRDIVARASLDAGRAADDSGRAQALWLEQGVSAYCDALDP